MPRALIRRLIILAVAVTAIVAPTTIQASHSWGTYHWARTSNPFTLLVGDNVDASWDAYLDETISDWSQSSVLDLTKTAGRTNPKNCRPTTGRIEACNARYGNTGWLGIAQIWISGGHIVRAITKVNDTYFLTPQYNTPEWRRLVMCQEIAHDFGLDHQDEAFGNANLGSCMDYTSNPAGPPSNEHPNAHDFEQLESMYAHLDSTSTVSTQSSANTPGSERMDVDGQELGRLAAASQDGRILRYILDLPNGEQVITHIFGA